MSERVGHHLTVDEALAAAWTHCAPGRAKDVSFPRGFWPDVARVAIAMFAQQTLSPTLSFRPTLCSHGNHPEPRTTRTRTSRAAGKISAAEKAANTAKLLAAMKAKTSQ